MLSIIACQINQKEHKELSQCKQRAPLSSRSQILRKCGGFAFCGTTPRSNDVKSRKIVKGQTRKHILRNIHKKTTKRDNLLHKILHSLIVILILNILKFPLKKPRHWFKVYVNPRRRTNTISRLFTLARHYLRLFMLWKTAPASCLLLIGHWPQASYFQSINVACELETVI